MLRLSVVSLLLFSFNSCIDEYWPEITDYQNLLVVDGMITNGPGPFQVDLSLSTDVNFPEYIPYSGCEVSILDNTGAKIQFFESLEGSYISAGNGEEGIIGRFYKIVINTPTGRHYESDFDELIAPTKIDTVYPLLEPKQDPNYDYDLIGYQFYVDTKEAVEESTHYFWRLEQTYEYHADFFIHFIFDHGAEPFIPTDSLYTCWITEKINDIYVFGTTGISTPNLTAYPLNYVSTENRAISVRYGLLVNQFTIGEESYKFWRDVQSQNSGETSLYTQQLYQIRGNIKNINDEDEPVLGYFTVAGKDTRRVFADRPQENIAFNYSECVLDDGDFEAYGYIWWTDRRTWPLYVTRDPNGARALPQQVCLDCRRKGGTIVKPEFWID